MNSALARRILAVAVDQPGIAGGQPHGIGMQLQPLGIGDDEHFEQPQRVLGKPVVRGHADAAVGHRIAPHHAALGPEAGEEAAALALGELFIEAGEEHAGQRADDFGLQEEILHEPLDPALAGAVLVIHPRGNLALHIEGQPVFGAAGDVVQMAAHRPEEVLCLAEGAVFGWPSAVPLRPVRSKSRTLWMYLPIQ